MLNQEYIKNRLNVMFRPSYEQINLKKNLTQENANKLEILKNKHQGKRCFVIGSSPSVLNLDLAKLNSEYTFTVNRGYKLRESGLEHVNYHVMSDIHTFVDDKIFDEIPLGFADKFLIYGGAEFKSDNVLFFNYNCELDKQKKYFQTDVTKPLGLSATVIYFAIQFAAYMGFKDIYLIGVDLDFNKLKGHSYKETSGEKERQISHSMVESNIMFEDIDFAGKFLNEKNITLYNASPCGIVDCIPRVKYEDLF